MARLKEYNGRFCESDYENTFIDYLVNVGWTYLFGNDLPRENKRSVIYRDDLAAYLSETHEELNEEEMYGTNLIPIEKYFINHKNIDTIKLSPWINCNTIDDYKLILEMENGNH